MNKFQRGLLLSVVLVGVVGIGLLAFTPKSAGRQAAAAEASRAAGAANDVEGGAGTVRVETLHPTRGGLQRTTVVPGSVRAFESAELFAKISGYLKVQPVDIGDRVKEGQLLAEIEAPELERDVDRAAATLERARTQVAQMQAHVQSAEAERDAAEAQIKQAAAAIRRDEARLSFHEKQFKRMKELFQLKSIDERLVDEKEDQFLSSSAAVDVSHAAVETAKLQFRSAEAKVQQALADVRDAEAEVQVADASLAKSRVYVTYTKIISPYSGVITDRNFHRGAFIRSAAEGGVQSLLTVQRTDLMRVIVQVPDRDVPYTNPGDVAKVEIDALPGETFQAKVSRLASSEDERSRSMRVEVDVPNPEGKLRDGMYGRVQIVLEPANPEHCTIPSACLAGRDKQGGATVFVVRNGKLVQTKIRISIDTGARVDVAEGLTPGDSVVLSPSGELKNGSAVQVVER